MPKHKKKKIYLSHLRILSLILIAVLLGLNIITLKNSKIHLTSNAEIPPSDIKISDELYDGLPERYLRSYPDEYGMCVYGIHKGYNISILIGEEPIPLKQSENDVEILCPGTIKGFKMIGIVHSHPDDSGCSLSENDISLGNLVMGLQCSKDKILFFSKLDNYTRGYYVKGIS